ncbi:MAG: tRNA adenosine(34) deaminase TadA [Lachnospiraceae bacterium]|nr:tRNA adenosine(34) deaminase TadA [Lachnospiraceae bacterium]
MERQIPEGQQEKNEKRLCDEKYMAEAIRQAKKASAAGEVPIGCVIVKDGRIIARGYNKRNMQGSTLAHAELLAIGKASRKLGDWRLEECTMYITLEPCPMCAGAIVQARIPKVVIGAMNAKAGCAGSILNLLEEKRFNHQAEVVRGVREEECSLLLKDFFKSLRNLRKSERNFLDTKEN